MYDIMREIEITADMLDRATKRSRNMGSLKNSITSGQGNVAGFLGEEVVNSILCGIIKDTKDFDIEYNGLTYDVKTKRCTSQPLPHYECSIASFNTRQKCDRYIFVRIEQLGQDYTRAWILGWYDKVEYFQYARKLKKGDRDGDNNFLVKADCYNFPIKALKDIKELICQKQKN